MPSRLLVALGATAALVIGVAVWVDDLGDADPFGDASGAAVSTDEALAGGGPTSAAETTTTTEAPYDGWSDPRRVGEPYPGATATGVLTFRGNPTRSYHGAGPVPRTADIEYRFPPDGSPMCSTSRNLGEEKVWCGMGWTGQPVVTEYDGRTWAIFGGYDRNVHFMDADTGARILPDFPTGDLIKGTPTIDPDGYPLVYVGSRDNELRILSFDGPEPVELWSFHADDVSPTLWNDDWDASPLVLDDFLFEGGENSQFVTFRLNRGYDPDTGLATVDPQLVWNTPSWDQELLDALGDQTVSVENSPMILGDTLYFANSGGLVQGWDISGLADGVTPTRTFRYWVGDDVDASIVADEDGFIYVAVEYERGNDRAASLGQLLKLDPAAEDPLVWSRFDQATRPAGIWSTPAIRNGVVYTTTNGGAVLGLDQETGFELWSKQLPGPVWGSPTIVDDVLLIGDCDGDFHAYDVSDPRVDPPALWSVNLGGCIEASPAVWGGRILIGSRSGYLYSLAAPAGA